MISLLEALVKTILRRFLVASLVFPGVMLAQGTINTYAGNDAIFADGGKAATAAHLVGPNNMAVDAQGNVYISASGLSMVLKVATNGVVSVFAGNGLTSGGGDGGLAVGASLSYPAGLAFDSSGNLYIADTYNSNVRKVDTNGIITRVAGDGGQGGPDAGPVDPQSRAPTPAGGHLRLVLQAQAGGGRGCHRCALRPVGYAHQG